MNLKSNQIPVKSEGVQLYNYVSDTGEVSSSRFNSMEGGEPIPDTPVTPPASSDDSIDLDSLPVKRSLFNDDMRTGLNTRDKWWVSSITNTTSNPSYSLLPASINQAVPANRGWSAIWDRDKEILNVNVEHTDQNNSYPFYFQSKSYINFPSAGGTFCIFGGTYQPQTTSTVNMLYTIRTLASGVDVSVTSWNIDQFQLPGNTGLNPSAISLDMSVNQEPTFLIRNGKGGGIVFGFTIDGHFHPAHLISSQNYSASQGNAIGSLNITARRLCQRTNNGNTARYQVGLSDDLQQYSGAPSGVYFESTAILSTPETVTYQIKDTNIFSSGAPSNNSNLVPFTADCIGNVSNGGSPYPIYTPVQGTGEGVEILSLRLTPNFNGTARYNKSTFYPTKLDVHVKGDVETDAVLCQVWYNGKTPMGNVYFPVDPGSSIDKSVVIGNIPHGQQTGAKLGSILVGVGQRATLNIPFLYSNSEARLNINGQDVGDFDYVTVVAVGEQASSANTAVSVVLSGIEQY